MSRPFEAQIQWRSPASLIPYVHNARNHPQSQIDRIASSIAEFGFSVPIIIDAKGIVIAGHGRLAAAVKLQLENVPVIVRDDLTPAQMKALRIADNKIAEASSWDSEALKLELECLVDLRYNLELTGFSLDELANIELGELTGADVENLGEQEKREKRPITCPSCGEHFVPGAQL